MPLDEVLNTAFSPEKLKAAAPLVLISTGPDMEALRTDEKLLMIERKRIKRIIEDASISTKARRDFLTLLDGTNERLRHLRRRMGK